MDILVDVLLDNIGLVVVIELVDALVNQEDLHNVDPFQPMQGSEQVSY
jgi:hypothetical protein